MQEISNDDDDDDDNSPLSQNFVPRYYGDAIMPKSGVPLHPRSNV